MRRGLLRLTYLESPPNKLRFTGFTPADHNRVKELRYTLTEGAVAGADDIVGLPFTFLWMLELSEPPWPSGLQLPHEVPRLFFGHRQEVSKSA